MIIWTIQMTNNIPKSMTSACSVKISRILIIALD